MTARLTVTAEAASLSTARAFVGSTLRVLGVGSESLHDARLLVTELMTGMLSDAGGTVTVDVRSADGSTPGALVDVIGSDGVRGPGLDELLSGAGFEITSIEHGWRFVVGGASDG